MTPTYVFELQAELCKAMSSSSRIKILHSLRDGPKRVGDIVTATGLPQGQVSRHLTTLRLHNIVSMERQGKDIVCQIANPKIVGICDLMRQVLLEQAARFSQMGESLAGP